MKVGSYRCAKRKKNKAQLPEFQRQFGVFLGALKRTEYPRRQYDHSGKSSMANGFVAGQAHFFFRSGVAPLPSPLLKRDREKSLRLETKVLQKLSVSELWPVVTCSKKSYQKASMSKLPRIFLILYITLACIVCDQASKFIAKRFLQSGDFYSYAGDTFRFQYAENNGAFLGLGANLPEPWRHLVFTFFVGAFLLALLVYLLRSRELTSFATVCLSLVCAGGLSNLIDRLAYDGRVVDFLNVGIDSLRTGIFNVADMAITFGALLMLLESFRTSKSPVVSAEH
jgi:signal peptidase II